MTPRLPTPTRHIALLRGINLGPAHKLPMRELAALFESLGCRDVATYIQSGNVVFSASAATVRGLAARLEQEIESRFGFPAPVIIRSAAQLAATVAAQPFEDAEEAHLHVGFLHAKPKPAAVASLDPDRSPGDRFRVVGAELFLHLPNGVARSKLTNQYFDRALATVCTIRNWRTVRTLADMAGRSD